MLKKKAKNPEDIVFQKNFGEYIKEGREKQNLYQSQVADLLGVTQQYYSHIEKGIRNVDLVLALKICQALKLSLNDFISRYVK